MIELKKIIGAFRSFFSSIFRKEKQEKSPLFEIIDVDQVEHLYDHITLTGKLCNQLLQVNKERIQILEETNEMSLKQENIKQFNNMDNKQQNHIKQLWESLQASREEKEELKKKLSHEKVRDFEFDHEEQDIPKLLEDILKAEEKQRNIQSNINYLEGEKGALLYSKEKLENTSRILRGVAIGTVVVLGLSAFILFLLFSFSERNTLLPSAILIVAATFIGTWIYIFQRYIRHEIKKNILTQSRAVELLNKQKIKYVNITNYLEYEYKKFNIKSGDMLRYQWEQYEETRKNQNRYRGINTRIYHLEDQVKSQLNKVEIQLTDELRHHMYDMIDAEKRKNDLKTLKTDIKNNEKQLEILEEQQKLIWEQLMKLQKKDKTAERIVERLIHQYLEDMQNFMKSP